eukprot:403334697
MSDNSTNYYSRSSTATNDPQSNDTNYYQIFVKGFEGQSIFFGENHQFTENSTVLALKNAIYERTGIKLSELILIFATKQLNETSDNKKFSELGIKNCSSLTMVGRLRGGQQLELRIQLHNDDELKTNFDNEKTVLDLKNLIAQRNSLLSSSQMCLMFAGVLLIDDYRLSQHGIKSGSVIQQSKQDLSYIPGLIISYKEDIFLDDSKEAKAQMPCGHVISRESMTSFLRSLVDEKKYIIQCPGFDDLNIECKVEWDYKFCEQVGVLTTEERKEFELGFERNLFFISIGGKQCPICDTYVIKDSSLATNRVQCNACYKKPESYDFCWRCVRKWSPNSKSQTDCGNPGCNSVEDKNHILQTCGVKSDQGLHNIPTTRSCPNCSILIEWKDHCRHITCVSPKCKKQNYQFCFVCLKSWVGHQSDKCVLAERQQIAEE